MVQFIKQEAEEKANEIRVAAEEVRRRSRPHTLPNTHDLGTQRRKKCDLKAKTASTCLCAVSLSVCRGLEPSDPHKGRHPALCSNWSEGHSPELTTTDGKWRPRCSKRRARSHETAWH
jgi:hypothetical protein